MGDEQLNKKEVDECISLVNLILSDCKRIKTTLIHIQSSAEINPFQAVHFKKHIYYSDILAATSNNKTTKS